MPPIQQFLRNMSNILAKTGLIDDKSGQKTVLITKIRTRPRKMWWIVMHDLDVVVLILSFLTAAIIILPIFHALKINPIIGYMLAGIILGPHGLAVVAHPEHVGFLADLGVLFLLFSIGLDLTISRIKQMGLPAVKVGLAQILFCGLIFVISARLLGQNMKAAIIIGGCITLSSTALCIRLLLDTKEQATAYGQMAISILLLQDLAVVPMMTLIPLFHAPGSSIALSLVLAIIKAIIAVFAMIFFGRYGLKTIYTIVGKTKNAELFTVSTLFILFGCSFATAQAGLSMALGAFLAGLLLAETQYHLQVEADMHPFRGVLLGLFFVTVGLNIDIPYVMSHLAYMSALVVCIMVLKGFAIFVLGLSFKFSVPQSLKAGALLSQGGEFAFIILGLALNESIVDQEVGQMLGGAIACSMVLTPLFLAVINAFLRWHFPQETRADLFPEVRKLEEHVVILGFGRIGQNIASILNKQHVHFVGVDRNEHVVTEARKRSPWVFYGDATHLRLLESLGVGRAKVVINCIDDPTKSSSICETMLKYFPDIEFVSRARDERHAKKLRQLGISSIALETTEISIQISAVALEKYGFSGDEVVSIIEQFRLDHFGALGRSK